MSVQQSSKQGLQSDSQKRDRARHVDEAAPDSTPVAGAFGREQEYPDADRALALADEEEEDDEELDDEDDDFDDDDDDEDDDDLDEDDEES